MFWSLIKILSFVDNVTPSIISPFSKLEDKVPDPVVATLHASLRFNPCATLSTYALILCCVAKWLEEFDTILSSSLIDVPDIVPFKIALVNILFVNVCVWSSNTNVSLSVSSGKAIVRSPVIVIPLWFRI